MVLSQRPPAGQAFLESRKLEVSSSLHGRQNIKSHPPVPVFGGFFTRSQRGGGRKRSHLARNALAGRGALEPDLGKVLQESREQFQP